MRKSDPKLKKAIGNVLNELDSDLNVQGYAASSDVEEALSNLDEVIIALDSVIDLDQPQQEDENRKPSKGFRDLSDGDDKE